MTDLSTVDLASWADGYCAGWDAGEGQAAEHTAAAARADGFLLGVAAASRLVNNAIADACRGIPADAAAVVRRMVATWPTP